MNLGTFLKSIKTSPSQVCSGIRCSVICSEHSWSSDTFEAAIIKKKKLKIASVPYKWVFIQKVLKGTLLFEKHFDLLPDSWPACFLCGPAGLVCDCEMCCRESKRRWKGMERCKRQTGQSFVWCWLKQWSWTEVCFPCQGEVKQTGRLSVDIFEEHFKLSQKLLLSCYKLAR